MGGRESQRLIVPSKRGNQTEGPRRGKEVPSHEPLKGNMPGTLRPEPCPRNDDGSRGSRIHEMRNRVRVMCKPGSVGGRGGQPPRSTRPGFRHRISRDTGFLADTGFLEGEQPQAGAVEGAVLDGDVTRTFDPDRGRERAVRLRLAGVIGEIVSFI